MILTIHPLIIFCSWNLIHFKLQPNSSNSMMLPGMPETLSKVAISAQVNDDASNIRYPSMSSGFLEQKRMMDDTSEPMNHPSKLAKLEGGRAVRTMMNQSTSTVGGSASNPVFGTGSSPANRILSSDGMQYQEKQAPQVIRCYAYSYILEMTRK